MKKRSKQPASPEDAKRRKQLDELLSFSNEQMRLHGVSHFILDDSGNVVPASLYEWVFWYEKSRQRVIQQDYTTDDNFKVSTIFTGLDMSYRLLPGQKPLVFETMVFGPEETKEFNGKPYISRPNLWTDRCATLTEALAMHKRGQEWLDNYLGTKHARQTTPGTSGGQTEEASSSG